MNSSVVRSKISNLTRSPGVYFMKDSQSRVIYVGKAKDLKARVSSYFVDSKDHSPKTRKLVSQIVDFEVMLVQTEVEALLLERTLIKHHQPQFNILLRDDKEYPYIRIHFGDDWPRIDIVRRRKDDGAEYFGPFTAPGSLRQGMDAVRKVFPLIRCSPWEFQHAKRVCNYYHMKMCLGPCVLPVEPATYKAMLRDAMELILGKNQEVLNNLNERMMKASEREQYELAAQYRDQIRSIESLKEKQSVILDSTISADVIGKARREDIVVVHVLTIRSGKVIAGSTYPLKNEGPSDDSDTMSQFILQYYDGRDLPQRIVLPEAIEHSDSLVQALMTSGTQKTAIYVKKNLHKVPWHDLSAIAEKNAIFQLEEIARTTDRARTSLEALQATLSLPRLPARMECIDISNFQETAIVASNVCFINGKPEKSLYRSYNIQTVSGAPDDFASIFEVVKRRLERGVRDGDLPDLLVIDGGKGQLDSAMKALAEFPGLDLCIVSLAKSRLEKSRPSKRKKDKVDASIPRHSFERVFKPGLETPIPLAPGSPSYRLMTRIRDEAHRFAITRHRSKRSKIANASPLDDIAGIGPKLRSALLQTFGSLDHIAKASLSDLQKIKGVSEELAVRIHARFVDETSETN